MSNKQLVPLEVRSGECIWIESESDWTATRGNMSAGQSVGSAVESVESEIDRVLPALKELVEKLAAVLQDAAETEIEFGIKLGAKAGVILASADTEAHFKIKSIWRKKAG